MKRFSDALPFVITILAAVALPLPAKAQPAGTVAPAQETVIKIDPVALVKAAASRRQGSFKVSERQAVEQMDAMLTQQYSARGRISNERDAYLKSLYYQASMLLLNGYPIAGGTLVSVARNDARFGQSAAGPGMAAFVDAMLQPTDEDPDLLDLQKRMERARAGLKDLRPDLRFYADLWVVGSIYRDDIAVDAGKAGAEAMKVTAAEKKVIQKALAVK